MKRVSCVLFSLLTAVGCANTESEYLSFNPEQYQAIHLPENTASDKVIKITMPDGELLSGKIHYVDKWIKKKGSHLIPAMGDIPADGRSSTFLMGDDPNSRKHIYAVLNSEHDGSGLKLEVIGVYRTLDNRGYGRGRTNDGRHYDFHFEVGDPLETQLISDD